MPSQNPGIFSQSGRVRKSHRRECMKRYKTAVTINTLLLYSIGGSENARRLQFLSYYNSWSPIMARDEATQIRVAATNRSPGYYEVHWPSQKTVCICPQLRHYLFMTADFAHLEPITTCSIASETVHAHHRSTCFLLPSYVLSLSRQN